MDTTSRTPIRIFEKISRAPPPPNFQPECIYGGTRDLSRFVELLQDRRPCGSNFDTGGSLYFFSRRTSSKMNILPSKTK